ncbi:cytochrome P450 4d1-like [Condylostylus longicornis]|uniref:cytochrome P450 4d1-like n=1 Tax=Condylostylus longicornis TaxID=2530218 RepID=UPI00244E028E|nr:cytochrome P450 4d1-like [Condylostylus longicornis]
MFLTIILIGILTFIFSYLYVKYARILQLSKKLPGPPTIPILGNALSFIGQPPEQIILKALDLFDKFSGDGLMKIWIGPELNILISNLKDIEEILGRTIHNDKAGEYHLLEAWMGEGLLISKGKKWFQRRKIITPAFHFKILEQFIDIFEEQGNILVEQLKKQIGKEIDLYNYFNLATLDVICETAMGVKVNAQTNSDSKYVLAARTMSKVLHKRMFDLRFRPDILFKFSSLASDEKNALKIMHDFSEKVIISRRNELIKSSDEEKTTTILDDIQNDLNDLGVKRKLAFLDILLKSEIDGKPLTNLDIREEVDTFMFEGHDTTSSAILFFFYNIATNPKAQQKCYDEIIEVLGTNKKQSITISHLNNLSYIELCVKETLRMYPSVPIIGREIKEESVINGKTIPAGTNVGISPLQLGFDENLYPNPEEFIPERFDLATSAERKNPYAYIPFSAGPRNCIGQKFAMLEIKSVVTNVLRNFEVEYVGNEKPVLIAELILKSRDPLIFKLKERI